MQFNKGDGVRFLNEKGEGIITRIMGNGMVMVETSEGFEYPYPAAQLVPIKPIEKSVSVKENSEQIETSTKQEKQAVSQSVNSRFPDGIYLTIEPQHQAFPSAGKLDLHLYNHSSYDIFYTISIKDGREWICIESGAIRPRAERLIETVTPQELDDWGQLKTDILFYSGDAYEHLAPVSALTKFNAAKFFKDQTYQPHVLTEKKAWVDEIILLEAEAVVPEKPVTAEDIRRMMLEKEKRQTNSKSSVPHQKNQNLHKEIDLHIEELMDNWQGLTNGQLLDIQLKRVIQEMDEAQANHTRTVVFIHGIGNGRLKQEVRRVLSGYKGARFHDASFQRYGSGATEVVMY
jgi:Domain of unknown function (DUF2027)/Smr domain